MSILMQWSHEGDTITVAGNQPLCPHDPDKVWVVLQGAAEVFLTLDSRSHLFSLQPGDLLVGLPPPETGELVVTGLPDTQLLELPVTVLEAAAKQDPQAVTSALNRWICQLSQAITVDSPPRRYLEPSQEKQAIPAAASLTALSDVAWITSSEQLRVFGDERFPLPDDGPLFPLSAPVWLEAMDETAAAGIPTPEYLDQPDFMAGIAAFHRFFLHVAAANQETVLQEEKVRLEQKAAQSRSSMKESLQEILQVMEDTPLASSDSDRQPLAAVCQEIGQVLGVDIIIPEAEVTVDAIARSSRLRYRQVTLQHDWWKNDCGPLLAFTAEEHQPVALLPLSPTAYEIYNPTTGERQPVNAKIAATLEYMAYTFYRPFPAKKLGPKDLYLFSRGAYWRSDLRMMLLCGVMGGLLGLAIPQATAIIFDSIIPEGNRSEIWQIAMLLTAAALATALFDITRAVTTLRIKTGLDYSLQSAVWDRVLSLPVPFFKDYSSGELAQRAMSINEVRNTLSDTVMSTILGSVFSIFFYLQMYIFSVRLALAGTLLVLLTIGFTILVGLIQVRYNKELMAAQNKLSGFVLQLLTGVNKLRVAGVEERAFLLWSRRFGVQRKTTYKMQSAANYLLTFNAVFPVLTSLVIFYLVIQGGPQEITTGAFVAFNAAFGSFTAAMVGLSDAMIRVVEIIPMLDNAKPILETVPEYDEAKKESGPLAGSLEVSHVSFRYQEDGPWVLNDVSLRVESGEYVAIVGPSGSGKSTLLRVLLGFEQPQSGRIFYDDFDLTKMDIRSIRRQLGVVLQNGQLMTGDIFSNIIGSNLDLTIDDAWEAARMAGFDDDIRQMPMGMHTVVSEGAETLSGGQRQRLIIARALAKRPASIYFDEATSALDNRTQAIVSESLQNMNITRIVIAHRLSTVIDCDRIYVMDQGRIVESGSYEELMSQEGLFAELAQRQLA